MITIQDILKAKKRISPYIIETPLEYSDRSGPQKLDNSNWKEDNKKRS